MKNVTIIAIATTLLFSCIRSAFNTSDWIQSGEFGIYPKRKMMVDDLVDNHKLIGLHYNQLIEKLGAPNDSNPLSNTISYTVATEYRGIDVISSSNLVIGFSKDSLVTDFDLVESGE